ncbi:C-X-C motif chemokine 3 isoform X2 [Plectropomus leopardus]|uniref:C-X-C motif chemokine 3 isoform X2 n=1 Tax=Plectropomus leopardus TaxID=160734 RepID=UPI001C4C8E1A|nr:C-X-C motif chemokine 3 isoform X2 [Plectropomus leopardus]
MNTAYQCIILLTCIANCTSQIVDCRCLKTSRSVKLAQVADFREYNPRPYCNKKEVIIMLKDGTSSCLDPNTNYTQALLRTIKMQKKKLLAERMNAKNSRTKTDTVSAKVSATVSATVSDTVSATVSDTVLVTASDSVSATTSSTLP